MRPLNPHLQKFVMSLAMFFAFFVANAQLQQPTLIGNTSMCITTTAIFTATEPSGNPDITFRWYREPLFGSDVLIETADTINLGTSLLPSTQGYKVSSYNPLTGQESSKLSFNVTFSLGANVTVVTAVALNAVCMGSTATVIASDVTVPVLGSSSVKYRWYDSVLGGNLLFEGNPYTTGPLSALPSVFVSGVSASGCESPRLPIVAPTLVPALEIPIPVAQNNLICNSDTSVAYLLNKPLGTTVRWWDALLGGNLLHTGDTLRRNEDNSGIANLVSTYYAEIEDVYGCRSLRVPVVIVKLPAIDVPLVDPPLSVICSGDSVTFTASSLLGGTTFKWYDALLGGNLIHTGATFNTGPIENSGALDLVKTYYVSVEDANGCQSLRVPVVVTTLPALDVPLVNPLVATACANDSVTFTATSLLGNTQFYWYDAIVGGNLLDSGATFNTGPIGNNSTANLTSIYYVEVVDANGCKSIRTPATVISLPVLDVPVVTPIAPLICSGDSVTFTATALLGSTNFYWYTELIGGEPIDSGATFNTGGIENTGTVDLTKIYYVEAVDANGCTSLRIPVPVLFKPALDVPIVNPLATTVCNGQSAVLTATSLLGSGTFNWYDQIIGGTPLFTGDTFTTPPANNANGVNLITTYYVESVDPAGCKSIRVPAVVITRPAIDLPIVSPPIATVCQGQSAEFIASSLIGDSNFRWYDEAIGGTLIFSGDTFNTGALTNASGADLIKTFSVEAVDDSGCVSLRLPLTVIIRPGLDVPLANPITQTVCNGDSADIEAISLLGSGVDFYWYTTPLGGFPIDSGKTFNTGSISNSNVVDLARIYYVEAVDSVGCRSLRTPATVIVTPALDLPLAQPLAATVCNGDSVQFTASTLLGGNGTFRWYDDLLAGNLLAVGDTFNTGAITNQGVSNLINIYYVEYTDSLGCKSLRTPVTAIVIPALDVPLANPPLAIVCNGDSATFVGTSVLGIGTSFSWYDQLLGGNLIASGDTFNTGPLVNGTGLDLTHIYYLETQDENGCTSLRTPVTAIVRPALDLAIANPITQIICSGDNADITAISVGGILGGAATFHWYDELLGGELLFSGDTFNTGAINNTSLIDLARIYYVEVEDTAGCRSLRTPATVIIRPALDIPVVDPLVAIACSGDSVQFTATSLLGSAVNFHWYDALLGGNELAQGDTFNTGPIINNGVTDLATIFYVEIEDTAGCRSIRVPATVLSIPALDLPIVTPPAAIICNGDSVTFEAISVLGSAKSFLWYDALVGGNLLFEGDSFNTGPITNATGLDLTQTYYVELKDTNGCTSLRVPAIVVVRPAIVPPLPIPLQTICSGNSAELTAIKLLGGTLRWYEDLTSTTPVFEGDTFTTEILYNTGLGGILVDYFVESVDSAGCVSLRLPVEVLVIPGPTQPNITPETQGVCNGDNATFVASTTDIIRVLSYEWYSSEDSTTIISNSETLTLNNRTNPGPDLLKESYFVQTVDSAGCMSPPAYATLFIVPDLSAPTISPTDASVCSGETAEFVADTNIIPGSYKWYRDTTIAPVFEGDTFTAGGIVNTSSIPMVFEYFVKFKSEYSCESGYTKVVLTVNSTIELPEPETSDDSICSGESVILSVDNTPVNYDVYWYNSNDLTTIIDSGSSIVTPALDTTSQFSVKFVSTEGCSSEFVEITITVIPTIQLNAPSVSCETLSDTTILFTWTPVANASSYEISLDAGASWFAGDSTFQYTAFQTNNNSGATLIVRALQNSVCGTTEGPSSSPASCTYGIIDPENPIGEIFNSFSPNGDNANDVWYIADDLELFPDNQVSIFNRWGQNIFEITGYNNSDKAFTGENHEAGAYFYILEIPSLNYKRTGYVMIIR